MSGQQHAAARPARLKLALLMTALVALLELVGGFVAHSLALLSDAAHVSMDMLALGIALIADLQAARPANLRQTFGFARMEILAALLNGGLLFAVTIFIVIEALHRFAVPQLPAGGLMFGIAGVGAAVNVTIGVALAREAHENLNVKAALFHVASDAIGAFAVMLGGLIVLAFRAAWIDPALSLLVATIIVVGVVRIVRESTDVLLESAPAHADVPSVRTRIRALKGVVDVHDLHVWTLGTGSHALSAHILLNDARISEASAILRGVDRTMREEFGITHVTIQFEAESCGDDGEQIVCTQIPTQSEPGSIG